MIQKTFSLPSKVRKCEIFNRHLHLHLPLRQLGLQRNTLSTVFIVAQGYNGSQIHRPKLQIKIYSPNLQLNYHISIAIDTLLCNTNDVNNTNHVTRKLQHTLRRAW